MKRFIGPIIVLILVIGIFSLWYREGMLPVNSQAKTPVIFVVQSGESLNSILLRLENEKLIRNKLVFRILLKQLNLENLIQAGDFRLRQNMKAKEVAKALTHGTLDVWVTIVEGLRIEEIASIFAKTHSIPESVFISKARAFEGYLFPDTYLVPKNAGADLIIKTLRDNFRQKISEETITKTSVKGLTKEELVTMASLIERETKSHEARRIVAGILLNRLKLDMPLQLDATVQYALGYSLSERTWWKKNLTLADLEADSLYNTYEYPGLPPGPICNPGLDSIEAVGEAIDTDYLYYISDKTGVMHYARTLKEHNQNIARYLE